MENVGIIERAYQLAVESGSVDEIRRKLREEGYFQVDAHLRGPQIRGQLVRRLKQDDPRDGRAAKEISSH